jgi:hypothetical protein
MSLEHTQQQPQQQQQPSAPQQPEDSTGEGASRVCLKQRSKP